MSQSTSIIDANDVNIASQFVEEFFTYSDQQYRSVFCVQSKPMNASVGWYPTDRAGFYDGLSSMQGGKSGSFYVSTMLIDTEGDVNNQQKSFKALQMIVLDDIGTKGVDLEDLELPPTYVIESSAGNYQVGYIFDEPLEDLEKAKQLIAAIYGMGIADGGGALVNKYVRLPWGINNKIRDTGLDVDPVRLKSIDPTRRPSVDEVAQAFNVVFRSAEEMRADIECNDSVVRSLQRHNLIKGKKEEGILMECPWGHTHSRGHGDLATFYPIGTKEFSNSRGYNCFHDSCQRHSGDDVAWWLRTEHSDRSVNVSGALEFLLQTRIHEQANNIVHEYSFEKKKFVHADPLGSFLAVNARMIMTGEMTGGENNQRPAFKALGKAWQEHSRKRIVATTRYAPEHPLLFNDGGEILNEYQPPIHIERAEDPAAYLAHIEYLLPDEDDRKIFHNWVAYKLQNPGKRSYMYLMIAPGNHLDPSAVGSTAFGIGRSVVGRILEHVFQAGVTYLTYDSLVGKTHDWGDWKEKSQLVVVNEIKDESSSFRDGIKTYEQIKDVVDIYASNITINPKHKRLKQVTQYFCVLGFSNHIDAIRIPIDDRRVYVALNPSLKRSHDEYAEMHRIGCGNDTQAIADIFWWYMQHDVSGFDAATPPKSKQKMFMQHATETDIETVLKTLLARLPGDIVYKHHLKMMSDVLWKDECNPLDGLEYKILQREINRMWRHLPKLNADDHTHGGRISVGTHSNKAARVIRNTELWQDTMKPKVDNDGHVEQITKNESACKKALTTTKMS